MPSTRVPFPQIPEEFGADQRISFSKLDNRYILQDDDGSEWEFDIARGRWIPSVDEALFESQRQAYKVEGVDDTAEPAQPQKKRKIEVVQNDQDFEIKKQKKARPAKAPMQRKNTAVYVTSLPLDTDIHEVHSLFSRYGVIAEEIDSTKPRIKLYTDDDGKFKGDALVVYFRPESVALAVQMLDDSDFRLGEEGPVGKMRVKEADMSYKKVQDRPAGQRVQKDQNKIIKKTQKLNSKLADWDDDDPSAIQDTSSRWDKVVVLKHMFTLKELEEDPAAILDIKEDIREECSKLGEVTNVQLFDKEPHGVATVRFSNVEAANACVRLMDGRLFSGQKVEAYIADGSEKFKKSGEKKDTTLEDEANDGENGGNWEEGKRLDEFGAWLEGEGK